MDPTPVQCLINSISRFLLLASCKAINFTPIKNDNENMVLVLKLLKPLLDEAVECKVPLDDALCEACEALDMAVNEAREFIENWSPKTSKICSVLQSEHVLAKFQSSSLEICNILQSTPSQSSNMGIKHCVQEIKTVKQEGVTEHMEKALRSQMDEVVPAPDHLFKIIEFLGLTKKQEFLKETIAVEKERINAQANKSKVKLDQVNQIVDLISHMRDCMLKVEYIEPTSGVSVPPYFRCPLSMELMEDPVIVASGQTYDRVSIQNWLSHGLTVCPKTRQILDHADLIPNHTVKAMIANWSQRNNDQLPTYSRYDTSLSQSCPSNNISSHDLIHTESFRCSLRSSSFTSRSSYDMVSGFDKLKINVSSALGAELNSNQSQELDNYIRSPEQSYAHSRSESVSSNVSTVDYVISVPNEPSGVSMNHENTAGVSGPSNADSGSDNCQYHGGDTPLFHDSRASDTNLSFHVKKLVEGLRSKSSKIQTEAAAELRLLSKHNRENRAVIGRSGAIMPLLILLYTEVKVIQEHAVTALLNLSINEENKAMIAEAGAIEPLIHVLNTGNDGAKENSAAALFSLSGQEGYKAKIGRTGAVRALVKLLSSGTARGKKDAAAALFSLSIFHENKARIVQAGAVKYLVQLMDPGAGMVDKAVALLANLSTVGEGRAAIVREGGIPILVETVESGLERGKENAAAALLQLCINSSKFCNLVLQEGAIPPLVALCQSGTPRAKEKARQLLSHFRNQREVSMKKIRS